MNTVLEGDDGSANVAMGEVTTHFSAVLLTEAIMRAEVLLFSVLRLGAEAFLGIRGSVVIHSDVLPGKSLIGVL